MNSRRLKQIKFNIDFSKQCLQCWNMLTEEQKEFYYNGDGVIGFVTNTANMLNFTKSQHDMIDYEFVTEQVLNYEDYDKIILEYDEKFNGIHQALQELRESIKTCIDGESEDIHSDVEMFGCMVQSIIDSFF